ncbi:MAG: MBL fold metallo-hydrolase [Bifidobacteriaceae bacterium]|jgi:glyoxylase-like metal-dependent hydrolase (beta-lactamase superfamily II)|nr:MBL fold metallo-hydrolase [Bifidobacteriaceae bacterium]
MTNEPIFLDIDTPHTSGPLPYFRVGDIKAYQLSEFDALPLPTFFFPQIHEHPLDPDAWYTQPPHQLNGRLRLNQQSHLLDTPEGWVIIDAAGGNEKVRAGGGAMHNQHRPWLEQLALVGIGPEDISYLVFTHLHGDHVGFATALAQDGAWRATFPNARYKLAQPEWDYWTSRGAIDRLGRTGDYISDSIRPLGPLGVLDLVPADAQITESIRFRPAFGHTPGNVTIEVTSGGATALFIGDLIHNALQFAHPDWSTALCVDGAQAAKVRLATLNEVADTDTILVPEHLPWPSGVHVLRDGDAFRFDYVKDER